MKRMFSTPLACLIYGGQLLAVVFLLISSFLPIPMPLKITIALLLASPLILGIPIAESYFQAKEGTLGQFLLKIFKGWKQLLLCAILLGVCAFASKVEPPLAIVIGITGAILASVHGSMSGSFFNRMFERGWM